MKLRIILLVVVASVAGVWWWHFNSRKTRKPISEDSTINVPVSNYPPKELFHGRTHPIREIASRYLPTRKGERPNETEQHSYPDRNITIRPDGALQTQRSPRALSAAIGLSFD